MGFFTKADYSRQLRQHTGTTVTFSGSSDFGEFLTVGSGITIGTHGGSYNAPGAYGELHGGTHSRGNLDVGGYIYSDGPFTSYKPFYSAVCSTCASCSTGHTFVVGPHSITSGTCNVAMTTFSGVSANTVVVSVGQTPMDPITGSSANPGISASTVQINRNGLLDATGSYNDLSIDTSGNVVMGSSSSARYKTNLNTIERGRYMDLLKLNTYTFKYKANGIESFGLIAEEVDRLGLTELVMYDSDGKPDNVQYKLLSVSLLHLLQDLYSGGIDVRRETTERDSVTKVVNGGEYTTNGEYLIVVKEQSKIKLNSESDTKIKVKSLSDTIIVPDKGLIDGRWETISLDGDSSVEFVFVDELGYWVIVSSDGLKDS
tara:strand:- start:1826 stop:2944 length:1119 start_codon:yes stop_codon:yes gene_type:complete